MSVPSDETLAVPGVSSSGGERTDDALIAAAREGDARAFETLLTRHEQKVVRVLTHLGVAAQDREDVAQEVFLRAFRHLGGFRAGQSFGAWVYRIAVNAAHDHRSRRGRHAEVPYTDEMEASAPAEDGSLRRRLEKGLELLSDRERAVFVLKELEGLETHDVAKVLGITSITVRRHLGLAKDRLRKHLEKES